MISQRLASPDLDRIFRGESVTGLSDWQLLERYLERRDETAFEALVTRHGSMVLGVCRRMLGGSPEAEDAFQATFLILVRRRPGHRAAGRDRALAVRSGDPGCSPGPEPGRPPPSISGDPARMARPGPDRRDARPRSHRDSRPGIEPAAWEVPVAARPLLPSRPDSRGGRATFDGPWGRSRAGWLAGANCCGPGSAAAASHPRRGSSASCPHPI